MLVQPETREKIRSRFEAKLMPEPNSGCWLWLGAAWKCRDGGLRAKSTIGKTQVIAARVAHELYIGLIPTGRLVCHKCDTPLCVNPDHLYAGTHADNMDDMRRRGRQRTNWTAPARPYHRGEANPRAKLTADQARSIRASASGAKDLARRYGVATRTIADIKTGRTWAQV